MDEDSKAPPTGREPTEAGLTEAELAGASLEALVVRLQAARRNAALARSRADYQNANNNHREAVHYQRLITANEKMAQAERRAIVESNPDVLKGRQQSIVYLKESALWSAEAEALRLYIMARSRVMSDEPTPSPGRAGSDGQGGNEAHDEHQSAPADQSRV